jgi:hypothetical protein
VLTLNPPISLPPLFLEIFGRVCEVASSSAAALTHLGWVYAGCLLPFPAPAAVRLGLFGDELAGYTVTVDGAPGAQEAALTAALLHLDLELLRRPLFLQPRLLGLHAAWAARGGRAVLLVGEGGCGKSSLCYLLASRGLACGSEEVAAFSGEGRLLPFKRRIMWKREHPLISRLGIEQDSRNLLAGLDGRFYVLPPGVSWASAGFYDCVFAFLRYQEGGPDLETIPLDTMAALERLGAASFDLRAMSRDLFAALVRSLGPERAVAVNYASLDAAMTFILELVNG